MPSRNQGKVKQEIVKAAECLIEDTRGGGGDGLDQIPAYLLEWERIRNCGCAPPHTRILFGGPQQM